MFLYESLERIIQVNLSVYKHGQCLYKGLESCDFEYELDAFRICASEPMDEEKLQLIRLVVEQNEKSQPFWLRVLKGLSFTEDEMPKQYRTATSFQVWLLKGKDVLEHTDSIQAVCAYSETLQIRKDELLIIKHDQDEITPELLIGHLETELLISGVLYVGPLVDKLGKLNWSYNEAEKLKTMNMIQKQHIIAYEAVLFERLMADIPSTAREQLLESYLSIYPVHLLTEELLETTYGFFEHNLNVTDTANALFLHRNTLVYRLNRIHQLTHLDIRKFDDANKMKILLSLK